MSATERLNAALEGRYRIEKQVGQGGMATVYLAQDLKHDRKVAVKILKPELAAVLGAERFVVEIKTTAALQHPHILPLWCFVVAGWPLARLRVGRDWRAADLRPAVPGNQGGQAASVGERRSGCSLVPVWPRTLLRGHFGHDLVRPRPTRAGVLAGNPEGAVLGVAVRADGALSV